MPRIKTLVVLRPPVKVMQPVPAPALPAEDALPGGVQYTIKLDGIRATAHVLEEHAVQLVSRRGNDLGTRFPQLIPALSRLPVGLVLDGEIVATGPDGRLDFTGLLRTPAARATAGLQVLFVAFDVLSVPGQDMRDRPLRERWAALEMVLAGVRPPLQLCMATSSRAEALSWYRGLQPMGIEGICAKGWDTRYHPAARAGAWQKVRYAETVDARVLAVTGTPSRPQNLLVRLPDGATTVTSPRLAPIQASQVADALAGHLAAKSGNTGTTWAVTGPTRLAEVVVGTGRHGKVRFVRLRPEE